MNGKGARTVRYSRQFLRLAKKLPVDVVNQAKEKEQIFRQNPFDYRLKTHKLHGRQRKLWAFWINQSYRIIFVFLDNQSVLFLEIGAHNIYA